MSSPVPVTIHKFEIRFQPEYDEFEADVYWEYSLDSAPKSIASDLEPRQNIAQVKEILTTWAADHNYALTQMQLQ